MDKAKPPGAKQQPGTSGGYDGHVLRHTAAVLLGFMATPRFYPSRYPVDNAFMGYCNIAHEDDGQCAQKVPRQAFRRRSHMQGCGMVGLILRAHPSAAAARSGFLAGGTAK